MDAICRDRFGFFAVSNLAQSFTHIARSIAILIFFHSRSFRFFFAPSIHAQIHFLSLPRSLYRNKKNKNERKKGMCVRVARRGTSRRHPHIHQQRVVSRPIEFTFQFRFLWRTVFSLGCCTRRAEPTLSRCVASVACSCRRYTLRAGLSFFFSYKKLFESEIRFSFLFFF
jgi:hypothetical protein